MRELGKEKDGGIEKEGATIIKRESETRKRERDRKRGRERARDRERKEERKKERKKERKRKKDRGMIPRFRK